MSTRCDASPCTADEGDEVEKTNVLFFAAYNLTIFQYLIAFIVPFVFVQFLSCLKPVVPTITRAELRRLRGHVTYIKKSITELALTRKMLHQRSGRPSSVRSCHNAWPRPCGDVALNSQNNRVMAHLYRHRRESITPFHV